jgi:hypothetical protein
LTALRVAQVSAAWAATLFGALTFPPPPFPDRPFVPALAFAVEGADVASTFLFFAGGGTLPVSSLAFAPPCIVEWNLISCHFLLLSLYSLVTFLTLNSVRSRSNLFASASVSDDAGILEKN